MVWLSQASSLLITDRYKINKKSMSHLDLLPVWNSLKSLKLVRLSVSNILQKLGSKHLLAKGLNRFLSIVLLSKSLLYCASLHTEPRFWDEAPRRSKQLVKKNINPKTFEKLRFLAKVGVGFKKYPKITMYSYIYSGLTCRYYANFNKLALVMKWKSSLLIGVKLGLVSPL